MTDRKRLRQLAKKATKGPWVSNGDGLSYNAEFDEYASSWVEREDGVRIIGGANISADDMISEMNDADFIAAFNPSTALELLDTLDRYEKALTFYATAPCADELLEIAPRFREVAHEALNQKGAE